MTLFDLFWSPDPLAAFVIVVAWALFAVWAWALTKAWRETNLERLRFNGLRKVDDLAASLRGGGEAGLGARDSALRGFLKARGIAPDSVAARHVGAIFEAGWSDTRLDLTELSRLTVDRLFSQNAWLRSVLSLFIVVGLFGTLAGLSKALAPLAGLNLAEGVTTAMGDSLQALLIKLQSAFAPSVTGVLLTVAGVIAYAFYVRLACVPLRDLVDDLTIRVWIPALYPTASQRVLKTLEEADRQAQDNLEAAQKVAAFADRLDKDLSALQPGLRATNGALDGLRASLSVAEAAAKKLGGAAADLAPFREELKAAHERSEAQAAQTAHFVRVLAGQNARLTEGVKVLRVFETAFVEHQARVNEESARLLRAATQAVGHIEKRNEEVIGAVGTPVVGRLAEIDGGLRKGLAEVRSTLTKIEEPVGQAAKRIERIAEAFDAQMRQHIGELKSEFRAQNQRTEGEETALRSLSDRMDRLASVIEASSARQGELLEELARKAGARRPLYRRLWDRFDKGVLGRFQTKKGGPRVNGRARTSA